jgi:hypothetical protein
MGKISEKTRVIELPSGRTVTVKKPTATTFGKLNNLSNTHDQWEAGLVTISMLSVDPKISLEDEPKNGETHIDEFDFEDIFVLAAKTGEFLAEVVGNALPFLNPQDQKTIENALSEQQDGENKP